MLFLSQQGRLASHLSLAKFGKIAELAKYTSHSEFPFISNLSHNIHFIYGEFSWNVMINFWYNFWCSLFISRANCRVNILGSLNPKVLAPQVIAGYVKVNLILKIRNYWKYLVLFWEFGKLIIVEWKEANALAIQFLNPRKSLRWYIVCRLKQHRFSNMILSGKPLTF